MTRWRCDVPLPAIDDRVVPSGLLLGPDAAEVLAAAVAAGGGALRAVTPRQATYHPGRSLTVRYDATVVSGHGATTTESLVATAGDRLPSGALVLEDGAQSVAVWRVPHDPHLPGLALALDGARLRALLAELGAGMNEARPRLRAYRPGRRAVVEVTAPGARLFLKIVRPRAVEALQRRHVLLAGQVPVPRSLGWSEEWGMVALQAVSGRTLRVALAGDGGRPRAGALVALLDALPAPNEIDAARAGWQSARFASVLAAVAPQVAERVDVLARTLETAESTVATEDLVPVHGDFHEAQLLIDGGRVTGLLDVDTFGLGYRVDDLATMIGHLSVLALSSPRRVAVERYAQSLLFVFDRLVDPVRLREATAAMVLGLATGPFRVLEPGWPARTHRCVALAEQWLASARRVEARVAS